MLPFASNNEQRTKGKTCLVLTHANGFCGGIWAPFVLELASLLGLKPPRPDGALSSRSDSSHWTLGDWLDVLAVDMLGHGNAAEFMLQGALTDWGQLGQQIIEVVDEYTASEPGVRVVIVGHSLGGGSAVIAQLLSHTRETGRSLCQSMLLYEPMFIFDPRNCDKKMFLPRERAMESPTVAQARRRRAQWPSIDDARRYFLSKPMYAALDARVLEQFLNAGLRPVNDRGSKMYQLKCEPETEATIFGSGMNADMWDLLHASPTSLGACHVRVICGNVPRMKGMPLIWTPRDVAGVFSAVDPPAEASVLHAGHLWPLEAPAEFAQLVANHFGLIGGAGSTSASSSTDPHPGARSSL
jgi:pimeloyl-ACP methyl ester carboxylesterase